MTSAAPDPSPVLSSLIEPASAQGLQRITTGFNALSKCRDGWMLYHAADKYIGSSLRKYGEYSEGEVAMFRQLLRPGDIVVEAGANFGAHTVAMARLVGPQGLVLAFEPQRFVHQVLTANVALNSLNNVVPFHAALSTHPGSITVPVLDPAQAHNFGGLGIGRHQEGEEVPVHAVDGLNLPGCRLIKVDVEGMECEVLEGAHNTIARHRPILYVENDRAEHSPRLITLILSLGYRLWWHLPPLYNPDNFRGDKENIFGDMVSINMLCMPREMEVNINLPEVLTPQDRPLSAQPSGRTHA